MVTTKVENSAIQLSSAANVKNIWGNILFNVKAYGAKCDGSDETVVMQTTINAASAAGGGKVYCPYGFSFNFSSLTVPTNVVVEVSTKTFGYASYSADPSTNTVDIFRNANYTGGTAGFVTGAIRNRTIVGANVQNYEWGVTTIIESSANQGEHVGQYIQAYKKSGAGASSLWGLALEMHDQTGGDSTGTSFIGIELLMAANGMNTNLNRIGIDLIGATEGAGATGNFYAGLRINGGGTFQNGILITSQTTKAISITGQTTVGIDLGSVTGPATIAFRMRADDKFVFENSGTYYMKMNTTLQRLEFYINTTLAGYVDFVAAAHAF